MSEHKAVVWFSNDPEPNTFFFRSPFRSWQFVVNTILLGVVCIGATLIWLLVELLGALQIISLLAHPSPAHQRRLSVLVRTQAPQKNLRALPRGQDC